MVANVEEQVMGVDSQEVELETDLLAYQMALLSGNLASAARILARHPDNADDFKSKARSRYIDIEYQTPTRRYVNVAKRGGG